MNALKSNSAEPLVERLQMRDRDALAELLDKYGARMYGTARQFMRDEAGVEEVIQDTLIAVWNKIGTFQGRASLNTWLYRVTINAALMRMRKAKSENRLVSLDDDRSALLEADGVWPDTATLHKELGEHVRAAIDELREPARTLVLLADVEFASISEIAGMTHSNEDAVKSRLRRATDLAQKAAPVSSSPTRRNGGRPMKPGICPLCQQSFPVAKLYSHIVRADNEIRLCASKAVRSSYPGWVEMDGACERCWRHSVELGRLVVAMEELAPAMAA